MRTFAASWMVLCSAGLAHAATTTWTGNVSTDWGTAGNWSNGAPAYNTDVVFAGVPPANQPDLNGANRTCNTVDIQSAGWTIRGVGYTLTVAWGNYFRSAGAGTNTVHASIGFGGNSATFHTLGIGTGNTLVLHGTLGKPRDHTTGDGTLVLTSSNPLPGDNLSFGGIKLFLNGTGTIPLQSLSFSAGGLFGGTATGVTLRRYGWIALPDGGIFSPGDSVTPISTMTLSAVVNPAGFGMGGPSSKMVIDIGSTLGSNDAVILGTFGYDFNLSGCELALRGGGTVQNGDYTILTETVADSDYLGTFGRITYNGTPASPSNVTVKYNANSIVVSLTGLGVSKGTVVLLK